MRTEEHFLLAEEHVRLAEAHVARQKQIIEELWRGGHSTRQAEEVLQIFKQTLESHRTGLAQVERELKTRVE